VAPRGVTYERDGATLVISIPPCPTARLLLAQALWLLVATVVAVITVIIAIAAVVAYRDRSDATGGAVLLAANTIAAACVCAWFVILWRFVRLARHGRRPTVIRADDDRLSIASPLWFGRGRAEWPREDVADLAVRLGGAVPAVQQWLRLRLSLADQSVVTIEIPWPAGEPTLTLEMGLRLALGLPTPVSSTPTPR
jgi:hypothetical protein